MVEAEGIGEGGAGLDSFVEIGGRFGAKAGELGQGAVIAGALEVGDGGDAEFAVEGGDFFGAEAGDVEEVEEGAGEFGFEFLEEGEGAGGGEGVEFVAEGLAEALDAVELLVAGEEEEVAGEGADDFGAAAVGADFEGVFAFELEEGGDLL